MVILATLIGDGMVGGGFGRAERVALIRLGADGAEPEVRYHDVGWGTAHERAPEGVHHANIARFLKAESVDTVVTGHMGPGMQRMLASMGIRVLDGREGPLPLLLQDLTS
jgi:predicted Fe-Mo cluster-binding NifX family protein